MQITSVGRAIALCGATALCGCASLGHKDPEHAEGSAREAVAKHVAVPMPANAEAVRDDRGAPILRIGDVQGVTFPYVYGYPLYPEGDAARGLLALRTDNWSGAKELDHKDEHGVVHEVQELPRLGCRFEGIRENPSKFVPLSLTCSLPAPRGLGGSKRPVLGELHVGAKADQLLKNSSIQQEFLGAFHLTSDDFDSGSGTGYFNTTHGQLAFSFSRRRLNKFTYYFDPSVTAWRNPALWVKP